MLSRYRRFIKWMEYNPPFALTFEHWNSFNKEYKKNACIRYFIMKTIPRSIICPMQRRATRVKDWIRYRTYNRYHIVDTGLSPGYYEISEKILHASFNLLKDFVEKEKAWSSEVCSLTRIESLPLYYEMFYRKPELGIKHLEWESTLDSPTIPPHEQCVHQAISAREILALYTWWTKIRPARSDNEPEMYDFQGYDLGPIDSRFNFNADDYLKYRVWESNYDKLVEQWRVEDEEMLVRLIKIKNSLIT